MVNFNLEYSVLMNTMIFAKILASRPILAMEKLWIFPRSARFETCDAGCVLGMHLASHRCNRFHGIVAFAPIPLLPRPQKFWVCGV